MGVMRSAQHNLHHLMDLIPEHALQHSGRVLRGVFATLLLPFRLVALFVEQTTEKNRECARPITTRYVRFKMPLLMNGLFEFLNDPGSFTPFHFTRSTATMYG